MDELILAVESLSQKNCFDYFVAIAPLLLSLVAICISIYSTINQNKIALLDKRIRIYTNLKMCISNVIVEGKVTQKDATMFIIKARDVRFLFDLEVEELCDEIYKSILELRRAGEKVEAGINGSKNVGNHEENCNNEARLLDKMYEYSKLLEETFSPYISFKNTKKKRICTIIKRKAKALKIIKN